MATKTPDQYRESAWRRLGRKAPKRKAGDVAKGGIPFIRMKMSLAIGDLVQANIACDDADADHLPGVDAAVAVMEAALRTPGEEHLLSIVEDVRPTLRTRPKA